MKRSEDLAYWYLRLNGCLTVSNFYLHPPHKGGALAEADIVGVRFPGRAEFDDKNADDALFAQEDATIFLIAEAKASGECSLNASWTRDSKALSYVLRRFGPVAAGKEEGIAETWIRTGGYKDSSLRCFFLCLAARYSECLRSNYPEIQQRTWEEILQFFHRRFSTHRKRKLDHSQWDSVGHLIWDTWEKDARREYGRFTKIMRREFNLPSLDPRAIEGD
jgi:hypothetical protein